MSTRTELSDGPHYGVTGYDANGVATVTFALFAASAGHKAVAADSVLALHDYGHPEVVRTKVETLLCPTCKSGRYLESHSSKHDRTGFTVYCRHCEEGCVSPVVVSHV